MENFEGRWLTLSIWSDVLNENCGGCQETFSNVQMPCFCS